MTLPDPAEVKELMSAMSSRVAAVVADLVELATTYGVHGRTLTLGDFSFQLTRISERWSVYVTSTSGGPRELLGSRIDEKLLFLEHAGEFEKNYRERIVSLYEQLRKLTQKR